MTVWGETEDGGVTGEREKSEEVVEGGDKHDLGGILMGLAKVDEDVWEGGEGERDRSLLESLLLSSDSMMRLRILFGSKDDGRRGCACGWRVAIQSVEYEAGPAGIKGEGGDIWGKAVGDTK